MNIFIFHVQPIAFGVSFNLNLPSESYWSLFQQNFRTWQKRPRNVAKETFGTWQKRPRNVAKETFRTWQKRPSERGKRDSDLES